MTNGVQFHTLMKEMAYALLSGGTFSVLHTYAVLVLKLDRPSKKKAIDLPEILLK